MIIVYTNLSYKNNDNDKIICNITSYRSINIFICIEVNGLFLVFGEVYITESDFLLLNHHEPAGFIALSLGCHLWLSLFG